MTKDMTDMQTDATETKQNSDSLNRDIEAAQEKIVAFNNHWLNHKHLINGFAVVLMGLIFIGMLIKSIEIFMWVLGGLLVVTLIAVMGWREVQAKRLDAEMEAAQKALKDYQRSRRKKK